MHAQHADVREKIAGGDWSEETQKAVHDAVAAFAQDFGYDLDEEGQPLDKDQAQPPSPGRDGSAGDARGAGDAQQGNAQGGAESGPGEGAGDGQPREEAGVA